MNAKYYKNPARNKGEVNKSTVPYYQQEGIEPNKINFNKVPIGTVVAKPTPLPSNNPRASRPLIHQPYAETVPSPIGRGSLPNVGNNIEQTWSTLDGEIIDDLTVQDGTQFIDNNEYISASAFELPGTTAIVDDEESMPTLDETINPPSKKFMTKEELQSSVDENSLPNILQNLSDDEYFLMVNGVEICSGSMEMVQEQVSLLVFGDHEISKDAVSIDQIVVLKRVPIKVGVFLK